MISRHLIHQSQLFLLKPTRNVAIIDGRKETGGKAKENQVRGPVLMKRNGVIIVEIRKYGRPRGDVKKKAE